MSQTTRIAVTAAMMADAQLVALLNKDPDDASAPAIFNATKNQSPPVYDCVTYRISTASPDKRFQPPRVAGGGPSSVQREWFDIEAWTQTADSAPLESIAARLIAIFDGKALLLQGGGSIFWSQLLLSQPDHYDQTLNAWFTLLRFEIHTQV